MTVIPVADAELDVCGGCGGLWVDWFDGEVRAVAAEAISSHFVGRPSDPSTMHNESVAIGACPRCNQQLVDERYMLDDKKQLKDSGAHLLRCESCAGAFVSRAAAELLAALPTDEKPPPSDSLKPVEPLPWQKFMAVVRKIFGG